MSSTFFPLFSIFKFIQRTIRNNSDERTINTTNDTTPSSTDNSNTNNVGGDDHSNEYTSTTTPSSTDSPFSFSNSIECYACTQVGVPAFHSTSCDRAHQPEWEASAGSSLFPIQTRSGPAHLTHHHHHHHHHHPPRPNTTKTTSRASSKNRLNYYRAPTSAILGPILDPRSASVRRWNRAILLARGVALAVDPLFFYAISIGFNGAPCLVLHRSLLAIVTIIRTCVDAVHICHLWLQFRLAYVSRESLVVGCGKLVWDPQAIAAHYVRSLKGFWFDLFIILPIPQILFWSLVPSLIRDQQIKLLMTLLMVIFLFQFLPKVYHSLSIMKRMQKVTGYIFGTIWWGFCLNLIAYFIVSHVVGGCWYILAIQRVATCLTQQCNIDVGCNLSFPCSPKGCYVSGNACPKIYAKSRYVMCFDDDGAFDYGIYDSALPVISSNSIDIKILYPISWGLYQLSTFGNNLAPTSYWSEVIFCMCLVLGGVMLFTLLVGNIQVFLHAVMANKRKLQLRCRDMEWWMKRRQLPNRLRQRVQQFERESWLTTGGLDEMELIKDLPEGLRRDIKRYLCLDLIKMVPLFHCLDDLILDNICDRVKPLIYSKDEKIVREGDAVLRMVFIVHGRVKSSQNLSKGIQATSLLKPGGFLGDELVSWCLRRPFIHRLPAASATFSCLESVEAFGLDAHDLRYITEHFRYKFANDNVKRTMRYYSANWRTWAAVNIQFAWRRYMKRTRSEVVRQHSDDENCRLRQFAALFMSLRPHDHLD